MPARPAGPVLPAHYHDLDAVRHEAFELIAQGVRDRHSAFHLPVLATCAVDGLPAARTVVLRGFEPSQRTIIFHTDRRSAKMRELAAQPRAAIVFYDAGQKIQVRLAGPTVTHANDAIAAAAWARLPSFGKHIYTGLTPGVADPGSPPDWGSEMNPQGTTKRRRGDSDGFDNFAIICLTPYRLDWLYLSAQGHRRAILTWSRDGDMSARWVAP